MLKETLVHPDMHTSQLQTSHKSSMCMQYEAGLGHTAVTRLCSNTISSNLSNYMWQLTKNTVNKHTFVYSNHANHTRGITFPSGCENRTESDGFWHWGKRMRCPAALCDGKKAAVIWSWTRLSTLTVNSISNSVFNWLLNLILGGFMGEFNEVFIAWLNFLTSSPLLWTLTHISGFGLKARGF